jgi:hypothetical protein
MFVYLGYIEHAALAKLREHDVDAVGALRVQKTLNTNIETITKPILQSSDLCSSLLGPLTESGFQRRESRSSCSSSSSEWFGCGLGFHHTELLLQVIE